MTMSSMMRCSESWALSSLQVIAYLAWSLRISEKRPIKIMHPFDKTLSRPWESPLLTRMKRSVMPMSSLRSTAHSFWTSAYNTGLAQLPSEWYDNISLQWLIDSLDPLWECLTHLHLLRGSPSKPLRCLPWHPNLHQNLKRNSSQQPHKPRSSVFWFASSWDNFLSHSNLHVNIGRNLEIGAAFVYNILCIIPPSLV